MTQFWTKSLTCITISETRTRATVCARRPSSNFTRNETWKSTILGVCLEWAYLPCLTNEITMLQRRLQTQKSWQPRRKKMLLKGSWRLKRSWTLSSCNSGRSATLPSSKTCNLTLNRHWRRRVKTERTICFRKRSRRAASLSSMIWTRWSWSGICSSWSLPCWPPLLSVSSLSSKRWQISLSTWLSVSLVISYS